MDVGVGVDVVDIGVQTDLEEDPDIFYFAGGRTVASQTEYNNTPLSPTTIEGSVFGGGGGVVTKGVSNLGLNKDKTTTGKSVATSSSSSSSSSWNRGAGGKGTVTVTPPGGGLNKSSTATSTSTTTGGVKNRTTTTTTTGATTTTTGGVIPNYRSNIASRCRTAVNTAQLPESTTPRPKTASSSAQHKTVNKSASSSSGPHHPAPAPSSSTSSSPPLSPQIRPRPLSSSCRAAAAATAFSFLPPPPPSAAAAAAISKSHPQQEPSSRRLSTPSTTPTKTITSNRKIPSTTAPPRPPPLLMSNRVKDTLEFEHQQEPPSDHLGPGAPAPAPAPPPPSVSFSSAATSTSKPGGIGIIRSKSMINPFSSRMGAGTRAGTGAGTGGGGVIKRPPGTGGTGPKRTNSGGINLKSFASSGGGAGGGGSGSFKRLHSNSYISLPDETSYQQRNKSQRIDADGWETVKTRSSRPSKWSSSNSSIGSSTNANNQSRNSLDKGTNKKLGTTEPSSASTSGSVVPPPSSNEKGSSTSGDPTPNPTPKATHEKSKKPKSPSSKKSSQPKKKTTAAAAGAGAKSGPTGSADGDPPPPPAEVPSRATPTPTDEGTLLLDDEEIQKKEADLDDAIREEELIEEELRQVEKDFERIENDSATEEGTMTDSELALSPEPEVEGFDVLHYEEMDDQYFFVSIDGTQTVPVEDMPPREPGRILTLREKLMSPAKKVDGAETLKKVEAKLAKAERNRENLLRAKFNRYVELSDRFESLNETTKKLVAERAELIIKAERRRKRAAEKRSEYIKNIQRKGHDEDLKAKEIAFINLLEAQNKRHDYFASAHEVEERLATIQDERRQRLEERAGKSSAVIARQSRIRRDWQVKLTSLQEKRRRANERITREKEERAKERSEMAQEKARDREERISALNAAKQAEKEELQKKIRTKQAETARRHEENMESIRQKAAELGAPRVQEENAAPSSYRVCTLCSVIIHSGIHEMQHIRSRGHLDAVKKAEKSSHSSSSGGGTEGGVEVHQGFGGFGFKFIADVAADKIEANKILPDRNRNKSLKKHSKKLMQKLMESGLEFEKCIKEDRAGRDGEGVNLCDPRLRSKTRKNLLELDRLISLFNRDKGSPNLAICMDRIMADIRKTSVQNIYMKDAIIGMNGLEVALKVLQCSATDLPAKSKIHAIEMIHGFILGSLANGLYILRGTGICTLMNLCAERWSTLIPDDNRWLCRSPLGANESLPTDYFIQSVVALLFNVLEYVPDPFNGILKKGSFLTQDEIKSIKTRTCDIMGYLVASGVVDRISVYCSGVRGPVDDHPDVACLLRVFLDFLIVLVYTLQFCWGENPTGCIMQKKESDGTQLLAALEASELAGAVSMSYSLLLHQGAPSRPRAVDGNLEDGGNSGPPPPPGEKTAEIVKSTLCLINAMARLDLLALQNVLASEAVSLQFRHIASQLLWQVVPHRQSVLMRRLLTELIISIGNFTVGNKHNQATIQSGQTPTVLQLLCTLPSEYFTDPKFKHNFIPTLLAATEGCPENKEILVQNHVDLRMLDDYLASEESKKNIFVRRMIYVLAQQESQQQLALNPKVNANAESKPKSGILVCSPNNQKVKGGGGGVKGKVKPLEESNSTTPLITPPHEGKGQEEDVNGK